MALSLIRDKCERSVKVTESVDPTASCPLARGTAACCNWRRLPQGLGRWRIGARDPLTSGCQWMRPGGSRQKMAAAPLNSSVEDTAVVGKGHGARARERGQCLAGDWLLCGSSGDDKAEGEFQTSVPFGTGCLMELAGAGADDGPLGGVGRGEWRAGPRCVGASHLPGGRGHAARSCLGTYDSGADEKALQTCRSTKRPHPVRTGCTGAPMLR
jgi:hypothetical protein